MSEPALHALIGLRDVALETILLARDEPLRGTEHLLAFTAHSQYREEVVGHHCERWVEVFASLTPPPERLVGQAWFDYLAVHDCRD